MTMAQRTLKTRPWDSAEHLRTEADMAAYLNACLEEAGDDPAFITHALGVVARARGMTRLSRVGVIRPGGVGIYRPEEALPRRVSNDPVDGGYFAVF
ncbi:addiction module antidote protein [Ralstonia solanacearum]|uniref:addiction module antidote protein n=1 Tax=Ralstonia solanacearum TaxID=305 RepID=UPI001E30688E|nr:addiction module antidote protein [Ralstonia solanacearum]